jgi:hypothetical protein
MMNVNENILEDLKTVRAANPSLSYDQAWDLVQARRPGTSIPGDLGAAARAIQASYPSLSFQEAWDMVEREAMPHLRKGETIGQALIRARQQKTERAPGAPAEVKATPLESENDWPKGKTMLVRGSVGTWVD